MTKHAFKNIRGESAFSKACSYRDATLLKRERLRRRCFPINLRIFSDQRFYRPPVNNTCKSRLHYRVAVSKNFIKWQESTRDRVLYIIVAGQEARNITEKTSSDIFSRDFFEVFQKSVFAEHFWVSASDLCHVLDEVFRLHV